MPPTIVPPSVSAVRAYREASPLLVAAVDEALRSHPRLEALLGTLPFSMLEDNHRNHVAFLGDVLDLGAWTLLERVLPWVYRAYHRHGLSTDYFPIALKAWRAAIEANLDGTHADEILPVYRWMEERHAQTAAEATGPGGSPDGEREGSERVGELVELLLDGRLAESIRLAEAEVERPEQLAAFYLDVLAPAMREVGRRWELGTCSVADEHAASSVAARIMAALFPRTLSPAKRRGRAVVTACRNEHHQLGAWMVSDALAVDGWDVTFLGANTPEEDLLLLLASKPAELLLLSVTMPFNLCICRDAIARVRAELDAPPKILVGGQAMLIDPKIWLTLGADGMAADLDGAVHRARSLGSVEASPA